MLLDWCMVAVEVVAVVGLDLVASCSICCPFINIASLAYTDFIR